MRTTKEKRISTRTEEVAFFKKNVLIVYNTQEKAVGKKLVNCRVLVE